MKPTLLLDVLLFGVLSSACGDGHHGREWTEGELAELEAKWGFEVCIVIPRPRLLRLCSSLTI